MTLDLKRKLLACLAGVLILTAVVAAALPQLELKPGLPLPGQDEASKNRLETESLPLPVISISSFWKAVLGILLLAGLLYNAYQMLRGASWNWKNVVNSFLALAVIVLVLVGLLLILSKLPVTFEPPALEAPPPDVIEKGPPLGPLPPSLLWLVWLGLAAALVGLGLWLAFRQPGRRGPDLLALEAERALEALKAGLDLKNVIVRCYWQMAQVLQQEQGLEKQAAMTVREFERLLEARGVPPSPVRQLTRLFEAVRYGRRPVYAEDERQAVDCLTAIVRYSQAGGKSR